MGTDVNSILIIKLSAFAICPKFVSDHYAKPTYITLTRRFGNYDVMVGLIKSG